MKRLPCRMYVALVFVSLLASSSLAEDLSQHVAQALERAGDNRAEMQRALDDIPADQRAGMEFLIAYMPERDLKELTAEFLLENVQLAYQTWNESPWKEQIPEEIFLNNVLPYANINEGRDRWRKDFYDRFQPLVKDAKSPGEAAAILNREIFSQLNVRYSTQRKRADQAPYESIKSGLASCTGLSILLIDACRSIGVPARFAGTPLWSNKSGNHSWVEVWDNGWHFTGAAEPTGNELDQAWFIGNAAEAQRDHRLHAIYAVSYRHTPQTFPLVWDDSIDYVFAINVTDRYTARAEPLPEGHIKVSFRAIEHSSGKRQAVTLKLLDDAGNSQFEGQTKDERFDTNDHLVAVLREGAQYRAEWKYHDQVVTEAVTAERSDTPVTFYLKSAAQPHNVSQEAIDGLQDYLAMDRSARPAIEEQAFAGMPLTRDHAQQAKQLLWQDHVANIREARAKEMEARTLTDGELKMPFHYQVFGEKPEGGRSLYISMHGGGGAPTAINDRQWENQKRLYTLEEGVYVAPRAPTDTWNLWHQDHIDRLFSRLIENMIVFEDVNPNRVYILGYSAGGDGVYQLAPRMADRLAAAAMMAGHPNETSPLGLRNIAFTLHVGGQDAAYNRNEVARSWQQQLAELRAADPEGYVHEAKIYADKGHWLDREDAAAIPWMAQYSRNPAPTRIVWKQDDVLHSRYYWLAAALEKSKAGAEVVATRAPQTLTIERSDVQQLTIYLNDEMANLDEPIAIHHNERQLFRGNVERTIGVLSKTLSERGDPFAVYSAEVQVDLGN